MKVPRISFLFSLMPFVVAQTPEGFTPAVSNELSVTFAPDISVSPGVLISQTTAATAPLLSDSSAASATGLYIVFMLDMDVVYMNKTTSFLHWFQPNLLPSPEQLMASPSAPNASTAVGASYFGPTPPKGGGPHDYTLLLFAQPEGFTVPTSYLSVNPPANEFARLGFNITDFITAAALDAPIAANYFRVLNGTAAQTSSAEASSYVASSTSSAAATATVTATATATASVSQTAGTTSTAIAADARAGVKDGIVAMGMAVLGAAALVV